MYLLYGDGTMEPIASAINEAASAGALTPDAQPCTFAEVAKQQKVRVPQIHLLIGNRLKQFEGPATAAAALSDAVSKAL